MSFTSCSRDKLEETSIDSILERGQRLKRAMVESILDYDPYNTDVLKSATTMDLVRTRLRNKVPLQSDSMSRKDETDALIKLKYMSSKELCETANEAYSVARSCSCRTCVKYNEGDLNCDLQRSSQSMYKTTEIQDFQNRLSSRQNKYFKYVDSLRVTVQELVLNENGNKKAIASSGNDKRVPVLGSQTFFIEYDLPFILSVATHRKVHKRSSTGVHNNSFIRICARRFSTEAITFKQKSLHNIRNVDQINLEGIEMKFHISCRTMRQKTPIQLGFAVFNFAKFDASPTLSCTEELTINFNDKLPIALGHLRVRLEMGCDKLYFGKEFIDSIEGTSKPVKKDADNQEVVKKQRKLAVSSPRTVNRVNEPITLTSQGSLSTEDITSVKPRGSDKQKPSVIETVRVHEKRILFGFLYIPEAQYLKANINSFISCRPFCQEDTCHSKVVLNESTPLFNFSQLVPLVYQDDLLNQLRDNIAIIEFWEKFESKNILFGITKLSLHPFYIAYRNPDVTKYLADNKLPVIISDWWESITNPYTDELVGQVQVLLALGTEQQIETLQLERGFKVQTVKANLVTPLGVKKHEVKQQIVEQETKLAFGRTYKGRASKPSPLDKVAFKSLPYTHLKNSDKENNAINKATKLTQTTSDKGVQSDFKMSSGDKETNDKLGQLLNQIITMQAQRSTLVDSGTNTDNEKVEPNANKAEPEVKTDDPPKSTTDNPVPFTSTKQYENAPPLVRSTSELLNTLQAALSIPHAKRPLISANRTHENKTAKPIRTSFKAQIFINQALHLPVRKRCKTKKSKGKALKGEDNVKPSTYVTFETMPGLDLKITPLIPKSTSPCWNFKCDVFLPSELLYSNQKRLIFKVWRKSTNTNMVPNLQSDLILGFATIDLTVLLAGFPNIQGWFNITDFSSKCNGQINIHVTPLEDLTSFKTQAEFFTSSASPSLSNEDHINIAGVNMNATQQLAQPLEEEPDEPDAELLSRALKRKFTELDEITQRLRLRLSHVTNDESDDENDKIADEFEKDINSLSIEDDFDMVNFEDESPKTNAQQDSDLLKTCQNLEIDCSAPSSLCGTETSLLAIPTQEEITKEFEDTEESLSILDRQLLEGKQRIDTLLGKLSLISGDANTFNARYVSGCSTSNRSESRDVIDTEAILKDLDLHSRPNILGTSNYDTAMFDRIYQVAGKRHESSTPSSGTSVISNLAEFRPAPDGQGTYTEDRNKAKK